MRWIYFRDLCQLMIRPARVSIGDLALEATKSRRPAASEYMITIFLP